MHDSNIFAPGKQENRLEVTVDGKKLAYEIGVIGIDFTPDKLKINRNKESNSADITLSEGFTMLINGRRRFSCNVFFVCEHCPTSRKFFSRGFCGSCR